MQKYMRFGDTLVLQTRPCVGDADPQSHSHTSNVLAMESGTREEKRLKETQTLQQGKSHSFKSLPRTTGVAVGGERALEPVAYRRCGGGGQERLYGKPTTEKVLWRGEPSSIWRGTQALTGTNTREKSSQNLPRAIRMAGG